MYNLLRLFSPPPNLYTPHNSHKLMYYKERKRAHHEDQLSHTYFLYVCFPLSFSLSFPFSHFSSIFYLGFCTYMWTRRKLFGFWVRVTEPGGHYCVDRFRSLDVYKLARPPPHLNGCCWEETHHKFNSRVPEKLQNGAIFRHPFHKGWKIFLLDKVYPISESFLVVMNALHIYVDVSRVCIPRQ